MDEVDPVLRLKEHLAEQECALESAITPWALVASTLSQVGETLERFLADSPAVFGRQLKGSVRSLLQVVRTEVLMSFLSVPECGECFVHFAKWFPDCVAEYILVTVGEEDGGVMEFPEAGAWHEKGWLRRQLKKATMIFFASIYILFLFFSCDPIRQKPRGNRRGVPRVGTAHVLHGQQACRASWQKVC